MATFRLLHLEGSSEFPHMLMWAEGLWFDGERDLVKANQPGTRRLMLAGSPKVKTFSPEWAVKGWRLLDAGYVIRSNAQCGM